jgi:hypothetical protein
MVMHYRGNVRGLVSTTGGTAGPRGRVRITTGDFLQVFVAQLAFIFAAHNMMFLVFVVVISRLLDFSTECAISLKGPKPVGAASAWCGMKSNIGEASG